MPAPSRRWTLGFVRNLLLWMLPVAIVWVLLTPFYNRFLTIATESLLHIFESPDMTSLLPRDDHYLVITRADLQSKGLLYSVRVTDTHFPVILMSMLFLAVPGVRWKVRMERLGWALLVSVFFQIVLLVFWVQFVYSTQLGTWSTDHYTTFSQNFWGLGKHLLDIPFKLALPFVLWMLFHIGLLTKRNPGTPTSRG